ncbi:hypothetical protein AWM68_17265 [Fictibacillus phosphorivorans]|uniref:Uncharacterized protein n=1 Tax=Fictibacillus phosphorivorans TaxID=1221500 RepID=A0A165NW55_9BACL|nr:hypothetical protein [Fictibacillus phosphorivorans]KZE67923.1 hypothetical protein AWM68_17265 [Fictibacillus phosphorivorans]
MSKGKKAKKQIISTAAEMMEQFIEEGTYPHLKQSEEKVKRLTSSMRKRLEQSESKRHEFKDFNLVGRFTAKKIYQTDYISLNEYLYDLGLLLHVVEIDNKSIQENELYLDMIQDFKLEDTFFVKPNFNKLGKSLNALPEEYFIPDDCELTRLARDILILKPQIKDFKNQYDKLKWKLLQLDDFKKLKSLPKEKRKPIPHKYGSLSLSVNQPKYDVSKIYDYIGEWLLIEYGKPSADSLERLILNGTLSKKEIDQFKTVTDVRLDFSVMSIDDERKILTILEGKNQKAAANRRLA